MDRTNNRIGSIRFDNETILEVSQKGGGGAGVGGTGGLEARNLVTGESTNEAIEDLAEDLEDAQETIETQAQTIEDQAGTIESQAQTIEDQQAIIDAFPTIEALNATANGTYSETGKAYSPVTVNVAGARLLNIKTKWVNNKTTGIIIPTAAAGTAVHPTDGNKTMNNLTELSSGQNNTPFISYKLDDHDAYCQYPFYYDIATSTIVAVTSPQISIPASLSDYISKSGGMIKVSKDLTDAILGSEELTITIS